MPREALATPMTQPATGPRRAGTPSTYVLGQQAHAWYPPVWHIAVVTCLPKAKIEVTFEDGSVSELPRTWIDCKGFHNTNMFFPFVVGQRVFAYYPPVWHNAVVRSLPEARIEVTFDNGELSDLPVEWIEAMQIEDNEWIEAMQIM